MRPLGGRESDDRRGSMPGPLSGIKVIELAGIGPGPFAAMLLADLGAEVVRIERASVVSRTDPRVAALDLMNRGRRSVGVDLKDPRGAGVVLRLVAQADALLEGFRPGVTERLGLGPDVCIAQNPRLIYGRMTGWGQQGAYAQSPGHDINYIALAGALAHIGRRDQPPTPPLNLVGDFAGGMMLAYGITCALLEVGRSGQGQVVDAAMIDSAAIMMTFFHGYTALGEFRERGTNIIDSGAHFYDVYECADGRYVTVGAIEPQFYAELVRILGLEDALPLDQQNARERWPEFKAIMADRFKQRTSTEWCARLEGSEACFAPVLSLSEASEHPHNRERTGFVEIAGTSQPAPAPRFSRTPGAVQSPPALPGEHTDAVLEQWGISVDEIHTLHQEGVIA